MALPEDVEVNKVYIKPHGQRLVDGRLICWGRAEEWKAILMALFELSYYTRNTIPYAAILRFSVGKFADDEIRTMVNDAADKLGIQRVVWLND